VARGNVLNAQTLGLQAAASLKNMGAARYLTRDD
jgi:hypothetical protein